MYSVDCERLPRVTMMGRIKQKQGWGHTGRSIGDHLLVVILGGSCRFCFEDTQCAAEKGNVLFVPANCFYRPYTDTWCEYYFFHFQAPLTACSIEDVAAGLKQREQLLPAETFSLPPEESRRIWLDRHMQAASVWEEALLTVHKAYGALLSSGAGNRLLLDVYFAQLLTMLSAGFCDALTGEKPLPFLLGKLLYYIQQHANEPLTLAELSRVFGVSKQYITRLFQHYRHTTPTQYIHHLKLENAKKMLKYSTMNVGEIAEYLGFSSSYYFCRLFKQQYFLTPTQYIREELARPLLTE